MNLLSIVCVNNPLWRLNFHSFDELKFLILLQSNLSSFPLWLVEKKVFFCFKYLSLFHRHEAFTITS